MDNYYHFRRSAYYGSDILKVSLEGTSYNGLIFYIFNQSASFFTLLTRLGYINSICPCRYLQEDPDLDRKLVSSILTYRPIHEIKIIQYPLNQPKISDEIKQKTIDNFLTLENGSCGAPNLTKNDSEVIELFETIWNLLRI